MNEPAYDRVCRRLHEITGGDGRGGMWRCPAHDDRNPSLSVTHVNDRVLLNCHAGCAPEDVCRVLDLALGDLFDQSRTNGDSDVIATYDYLDEKGELLFQVVRRPGKRFVQRRPDGQGGWIWKLGDTRRVPYRLSEVLEAVAAGVAVYIVEGEKDADRLHAYGVAATCNPHGAGKWNSSFNPIFTGADVTIVADCDGPGRDHARHIAEALTGVAATIRVVEAAHGKDVSDHLGAGLTLAALVPSAARQGGDAATGPEPAAFKPSLVIEHLADIVARVDAAPDPGWLARPVWPADAHGIIGAESKAGKTWILLDLAVAKASGGAWLGRWTVGYPGPVLLFLGEGGERKMVRRLRAVAAFHEVDLSGLPIRLCHRAPQLTALEHRALIAAELEAHTPHLVGLDPLYLAARGANGASLYEMGAHLEDVQATTQQHGAALVIVHHWNQTGTGKGRDRFSGAGPAEWGRVTMSVAVDEKRTDGPKSIVTLRAEFVGDEIPDTEARFVRTVWTDDPDDLRSPMHYRIEAAGARAEPGEWNGPTECMAAVERFFAERPGVELAKTAVGDQLRALNLSYRTQTVHDALERLAIDGRLAIRAGTRNARYFRYPEPPKADDVLDF